MTVLREPPPAHPPARRRVRALAWADAWLTAYLPRWRRHRPRVHIELGPWLPAWVLRLLLVALVAILAAPLDAGPVARAVLVLLAGLVVVWPSSAAPGAVVVVLGLLVATRAEPPSPWVVAGLVAGIPALATLGALLGRTGWSARVELTAVLQALPRFLAVQAFVQPLALFGGWLAGRDTPAGPGWTLLPLLAAVGLVVISFVWLPRLTSHR